MHHFLSNSRFSSTHSAYLVNITSTKEPHTYAQAILDPNWQKPMDEELSGLQLDEMWTLTPLPVGQKPIGCKWIYKLKYKSDGNVDRYKARLVVKGYTQIEGVDYCETFSPTAKLTALRCHLTDRCSSQKLVYSLVGCAKCLLTWQIAQNYLHGLVTRACSTGENIVCRINKSLYGLKVASHTWFSTFFHLIKSAWFRQSKTDYSLFTRQNNSSFIVLLIYVDDILLAGNDMIEMQCLKDGLLRRFCIKDLGDLKYFLGIEFSRSKAGVYMSQRKYALDIL